FMAPTLVKRIVDLPERVRARYDVRSMRVLVIAAAPCPTRVKEQAVAVFGPALWEFYGSTELGINTILPPADVLRKPGSCGRAAPGIELVLLDDAGRPVPTGTAGELYVRRCPGRFDGAHPASVATGEALWPPVRPPATSPPTRGARGAPRASPPRGCCAVRAGRAGAPRSDAAGRPSRRASGLPRFERRLCRRNRFGGGGFGRGAEPP